MRILICADMFPAMIDAVTRLLPLDEVRVCRAEDVEQEAPWAEVLIPAMTRLTAGIIGSVPGLKLIQQFGVGLEGVDIRAAAARGVPVANVPGWEAPVHAECTAEGGVFLMMACARRYKACLETLVINISRGPVVNEEELLEALDRNLIAGAGLDVLNREPPGPDHPLLRHEKVILTPHTAGVTEQSFSSLGRAVADNVERLKRGEPIRHTVNGAG